MGTSAANVLDKGFEQNLGAEIASAINVVEEAAIARCLTHHHIAHLQAVLAEAYPNHFSNSTPGGTVEDPEYGADFDMIEEVNEQIKAVRALRSSVLDPVTGQVRDDKSSRDVKEIVSTSATLLTSLMKFHEKIINQDRMRALEQATIEVVKDLSPEAQEKFFTALEEKYAQIK